MRSERRHPLAFIALAATASTWGAGANPRSLLEKPDAIFAGGSFGAQVWAALPLQPDREDSAAVLRWGPEMAVGYLAMLCIYAVEGKGLCTAEMLAELSTVDWNRNLHLSLLFKFCQSSPRWRRPRPCRLLQRQPCPRLRPPS